MRCGVALEYHPVPFETNNGGAGRGFGDNWLGPWIRFYKQTQQVPTLAFAYAFKIPLASAAKGLGTGRVDHSFTFLASKDIAGFHFDFNATRFLIGREQVSGLLIRILSLIWHFPARYTALFSSLASFTVIRR